MRLQKTLFLRVQTVLGRLRGARCPPLSASVLFLGSRMSWCAKHCETAFCRGLRRADTGLNDVSERSVAPPRTLFDVLLTPARPGSSEDLSGRTTGPSRRTNLEHLGSE